MRVNVADIRQQTTMNYLVQGREVIFNLAGQVSHIDSMRDPYTDLEINCRSQMTVLEACRRNNPGVKVVFAGTRQIYGKPDYLPVDENHLVRPTDVNGINKAAGEQYHLVYNNVFGVRACSLRLTNCYGPRQLDQAQPAGLHRLVHPPHRRGSGDRDLRRRHADARLRVRRRCLRCVPAGRRHPMRATARRVNVGGLEPIKHKDLVELMIEVANTGRRRYVEWPAEKKAIDIGSFYADSTRFRATHGLGTDRHAPRGTHPHDRVLPRASAALPVMTASDVRVPFLSLKPGEDADALRAAVNRVIDRGWFILGPELEALEAEFAAASGAAHAVGVNTGTDAIALLLRGDRDRPGRRSDHGPAVGGLHGARGDDGRGAAGVCRHRSRTPHHRPGRGRSGDHAAHGRDHARASLRATGRHDGALGDRDAPWTGARRGRRAGPPRDLRGTPGRVVRRGGGLQLLPHQESRARSAMAGAITTNDATLADRLKRLRNGGQRTTYQHDEFGVNSRLDEMQAAILRERLQRLPAWTQQRRAIAAHYRAHLAGASVHVPARVRRRPRVSPVRGAHDHGETRSGRT